MSFIERYEHRLLLPRGSCTTSTRLCSHCTNLTIHVLHGGLCHNLRHVYHSYTRYDAYHNYNRYTAATVFNMMHYATSPWNICESRAHLVPGIADTQQPQTQTAAAQDPTNTGESQCCSRSAQSVPTTPAATQPTPQALDTTLDECRRSPAYQLRLERHTPIKHRWDYHKLGWLQPQWCSNAAPSSDLLSTTRIPVAVPSTATTTTAPPTCNNTPADPHPDSCATNPAGCSATPNAPLLPQQACHSQRQATTAANQPASWGPRYPRPYDWDTDPNRRPVLSFLLASS